MRPDYTQNALTYSFTRRAQEGKVSAPRPTIRLIIYRRYSIYCRVPYADVGATTSATAAKSTRSTHVHEESVPTSAGTKAEAQIISSNISYQTHARTKRRRRNTEMMTAAGGRGLCALLSQNIAPPLVQQPPATTARREC